MATVTKIHHNTILFYTVYSKTDSTDPSLLCLVVVCEWSSVISISKMIADYLWHKACIMKSIQNFWHISHVLVQLYIFYYSVHWSVACTCDLW